MKIFSFFFVNNVFLCVFFNKYFVFAINFVPLQKQIKCKNMDKEQKIIHLHVKETNEHYYFGSIKALCEKFDKDTIGIVYSSLRAVKLHERGLYENNKCIIRQGTLIRTATNRYTPTPAQQK